MYEPDNKPPSATIGATGLILFGLVATAFVAKGNKPSLLAHDYAIGTGLALLASLAVDYRWKLRNLVRADLMAIASLYFLTLFEFLFPQPDFDALVTMDELVPALDACLFGFAGLAIGRHLLARPPRSLERTLQTNFEPRAFLRIYTVCLVGSYFYMLLAVDFDPVEMVNQFLMSRFSQPWTRGRYGDWKALLNEVGMLIYIVPPIAGIVLAKREEYTRQQVIYVFITFLFTIFYGFTSGTRNIFASFLVTFLVAYAFAMDKRRRREFIVIAMATAALMLAATTLMLEFRNLGLKSYWEGNR